MSCGYDTEDFIANLRAMNITPHIAQNHTARRNAIDERTTRHEGYTLTQRLRKRVEEVFGWMKRCWSDAQDKTARTGAGRLAAHIHCGDLQPGPNAKHRAGGDVNAQDGKNGGQTSSHSCEIAPNLPVRHPQKRQRVYSLTKNTRISAAC